MDKVSMSHLIFLSRYQTKCVIKFLFRQLMERKERNLENEKSFVDGIKNIFHSFHSLVKNKNLIKSSGHKL